MRRRVWTTFDGGHGSTRAAVCRHQRHRSRSRRSAPDSVAGIPPRTPHSSTAPEQHLVQQGPLQRLVDRMGGNEPHRQTAPPRWSSGVASLSSPAPDSATSTLVEMALADRFGNRQLVREVLVERADAHARDGRNLVGREPRPSAARQGARCGFDNHVTVTRERCWRGALRMVLRGGGMRVPKFEAPLKNRTARWRPSDETRGAHFMVQGRL